MAIGAVTLLSALAFIDALFNYVWTGNGIHGTQGALLVVVSTLLMVVAAALIAAGWLHGWVHALFEVLIGLDFLGTGLAAYLLDAWILLGLVVLTAIAWLVHLLRPSPHPAQTAG